MSESSSRSEYCSRAGSRFIAAVIYRGGLHARRRRIRVSWSRVGSCCRPFKSVAMNVTPSRVYRRRETDSIRAAASPYVIRLSTTADRPAISGSVKRRDAPSRGDCRLRDGIRLTNDKCGLLARIRHTRSFFSRVSIHRVRYRYSDSVCSSVSRWYCVKTA